MFDDHVKTALSTLSSSLSLRLVRQSTVNDDGDVDALFDDPIDPA